MQFIAAYWIWLFHSFITLLDAAPSHRLGLDNTTPVSQRQSDFIESLWLWKREWAPYPIDKVPYAWEVPNTSKTVYKVAYTESQWTKKESDEQLELLNNGQMIGRGRNGQLYGGQLVSKKNDQAKVIFKGALKRSVIPGELEGALLLKRVKSKNVLRVHSAYWDLEASESLILMKLDKDLETILGDYVSCENVYDQNPIILGLIRGLMDTHRARVVNLDLTPDNIVDNGWGVQAC